jgi:hypothetical protein
MSRALAEKMPRSLQISFAALVFLYVTSFFVFFFELRQVSSIEVQIGLLLVGSRFALFSALAVSIALLVKQIEIGWKLGVASQLALILFSILQVSVAERVEGVPLLLPLFGIFFQIAVLRMFFLRNIVVRFGMNRIKPWFRERRFGVRTQCRLKLVGSSGSGNIRCELINVSLSGCLFFTTANLSEKEVLILSPEAEPDIVLRVHVRNATHRQSAQATKALRLALDENDLKKVQFYVGIFESKLSDEEFNRILREKFQPDQPLRKV